MTIEAFFFWPFSFQHFCTKRGLGRDLVLSALSWLVQSTLGPGEGARRGEGSHSVPCKSCFAICRKRVEFDDIQILFSSFQTSMFFLRTTTNVHLSLYPKIIMKKIDGIYYIERKYELLPKNILP